MDNTETNHPNWKNKIKYFFGLKEYFPKKSIFNEHKGTVHSAKFSQNGEYVVTASSDATARVWRTDGIPLLVLPSNDGYVFSAEFSCGSDAILMRSENSARLFSLDGKIISIFDDYKVDNALFTHDGKYIITSSISDRKLTLWDFDGNLVLDKSHIVCDIIDLNYILFDYKKNMIICSSFTRGYMPSKNNGFLYIFSDSGELLNELYIDSDCCKNQYMLNKVVVKHDSSMILTSYYAGGHPKLWDKKGVLIKELIANPKSRGYIQESNAIFSPDEKTILTHEHGHEIYLWDINGNLLTSIKTGGQYARDLLFNPNGDFILITHRHEHGHTTLVDLKGKKIGDLFLGSRVISVEYSPDGKSLLFSHGNCAELREIPIFV